MTASSSEEGGPSSSSRRPDDGGGGTLGRTGAGGRGEGRDVAVAGMSKFGKTG
jgi:hypothetical protein